MGDYRKAVERCGLNNQRKHHLYMNLINVALYKLKSPVEWNQHNKWRNSELPDTCYKQIM